jgi:hypothetical protein
MESLLNSIAFKEEITPMFLELFCEKAREGMLPNAFYEASITLIPKHNKDTIQKTKLWTNVLMNLETKLLKKCWVLCELTHVILIT